MTLKIQTIAERLAGRFDGRVLLVTTGQQALSDVQDLQKLLDRFPVQIALGEADVDAVIRKTVLRKKTSSEKADPQHARYECGRDQQPPARQPSGAYCAGTTMKQSSTGRCFRLVAESGSASSANSIGLGLAVR